MKAFLSLVFLLGLKSALACSCMQWSSPKEMLSEADGAYLVIPAADSVSLGRDNDWGEDLMETRFSVIRAYKGQNKDLISIRSVKNTGGNCGMTFIENDRIWLMFTYLEDGKQYSNSCLLSGVQSREALAFIRELNLLARGPAETF
jgi:hypothetical protein